MNAADPRSQRLSEMSACAYRLGMAFGAEAERAADAKERVEHFLLFERCFFAVRVATALELRLMRRPAEPREAASDREDLFDRSDPPEREDREPAYDERDREQDRETERASLPILLRTLEGVAADAAALPGPEPAELPTLRELLARVKSEPQPVVAQSMSSASLRARLSGSGAAMALAPPLPSGLGAALSRRRATGPPGR